MTWDMRYETWTQKCRDKGYRTQCGKAEAGTDEGKSRGQQMQDGAGRRERRQRQWGK